MAQVVGAIVGAGVLYLIASGKAGLRPGRRLRVERLSARIRPAGTASVRRWSREVVMTFMFLIVILGATHKRAPAGFAGLAIGLALTLIHLISIPVTNTSVNPARSTGPALFVGGWALQQLWLFWVAPIVGAIAAGSSRAPSLIHLTRRTSPGADRAARTGGRCAGRTLLPCGRPRLPLQGVLSRCKSVVLRSNHRGASPAFTCLAEQSFPQRAMLSALSDDAGPRPDAERCGHAAEAGHCHPFSGRRNHMSLIRHAVTLLLGVLAATAGWAQAPARKPNILVIWGDDIGQFNISAYNMGMMGYKTPNIDSIAKEGAMFTDWYGQQSCTAGRAAFITGQSPIRTGLTKVGLPGAPEGMKKEDPTIATLLKAQGYMTGQFGKNHLGDRDEMLPTDHGFDEFFGNLYHLNAEEEPEYPDYPKNPEFRKKFGPRGVIHSFADGRITDTGPLTRKRMETIDEEVTAKALDFMERAAKADKPFFLWWNSTRMHIFTHLKAESDGKTGLGIYADGMVEHDGHVGQVLAKLKELGLDENTIVMYSTDNGAETFTWPDGGTTMFRGEKNTQLGRRLPRADDDQVARRDQARHGDQRHRRARGHAADARQRRRRQGRGART